MWQVIVLLIFALHLQGVVRRADLSDNQYIGFGRDPRFACVGLLKSPKGCATGTLIDPFTVLTAAHVVSDGFDAFFYVKDPKKDTLIAIKGVAHVHPCFIYVQNECGLVQEIHHDIALIHLSSPIRHIRPACLNYHRKELPFCFVSAGFGKHGSGMSGPITLDQKRRGFTNRITEILSDTWCDDYFISYFDAPESCECTHLEALAVHGDSGAPVFIESDGAFHLFGIVNLLAGNGKYGSFNAILPIIYYQNWIESNRFCE